MYYMLIFLLSANLPPIMYGLYMEFFCYSPTCQPTHLAYMSDFLGVSAPAFSLFQSHFVPSSTVPLYRQLYQKHSHIHTQECPCFLYNYVTNGDTFLFSLLHSINFISLRLSKLKKIYTFEI